jgi:tripartite-type tricarboxylate transporter receptor subunit TctC
MKLVRSFDPIPTTPALFPAGLRLRLVSVLAAALVAGACQGGGGAPPAPGGTAAGGSPAAAQNYPERPITFLVPFAAGGPTDTVTRLVGDSMSKTLGQQIVVQNRAGAGGTLAAGEVADAAPDGYTVLMHHIGMSTAPTLYKDLRFKPLEDFKTIGLVTEVPMTIVARKDFQPNTLQELVDYVKANKEQVKYAHAGIGAASHLCGLLIQSAIGAKVTEVPYQGTGPALTDLVGGQVDFLCDQTTNTTGQIKARGVKAYAVTTPERVPALPDLPTTKEAGLPDVQVTVWHGLYVPKDTPDGVVAKLVDALKAALKDQNVVRKFGELGTAPVAEDRATPDAHRQHLQSQIDLWKPIIEKAGVTAG